LAPCVAINCGGVLSHFWVFGRWCRPFILCNRVPDHRPKLAPKLAKKLIFFGKSADRRCVHTTNASIRRFFKTTCFFQVVWTDDGDTIAASKKASQPPTDPKKMTFVYPAFPRQKWAKKPVDPTIFRTSLGFSGVKGVFGALLERTRQRPQKKFSSHS